MTSAWRNYSYTDVALYTCWTTVQSITKVKEPTLEVELTPVGDITVLNLKLNDPTLEVALTCWLN